MITFIKQQYAFVSCIHNFHSRGYGTKRDLSHHCRPWLRLEESPSLKHTGELHAIVLIEMVPVRADSTAGVIFFCYIHACIVDINLFLPMIRLSSTLNTCSSIFGARTLHLHGRMHRLMPLKCFFSIRSTGH
jgi:hypothetical protein